MTDRSASARAASHGKLRRDGPDILLLGAEWPARALLRAQLIEDGHDVVAADAWPVARHYFRDGAKPRVLIVDLHGLPDPATVLAELPALTPPSRTLVIAALGTLSADEIRAKGFQVMSRPAAVGEIAAAVARML